MSFRRQTSLCLCVFVVILTAACRRDSSVSIAEYLQDKRAAVFVFLSPDCPLSQNYTLTLNELRNRFLTDGIEFYGVFPGKTPIEDFVATYKVGFPVIHDREYRLTDRFAAVITPEVFVTDSQGRTIYSGAIDNWAPELGQRRTVITEHYLRDALDSLLQNQDIRVRRTETVGCFIEKS